MPSMPLLKEYKENKMNLEVLVATMNRNRQEIIKLINKMHITGKAIIVDQISEDAITEKIKLNKNKQLNKIYKGKLKSHKIIYDRKKGLSRSRNLALGKAKAEIVLLADDDVIYQKDYERIIVNAYQKNPSADMIAFYVESLNPKRKVRKLKTGKIGWIKIFRVSSFQLTFKLESIKKNNLKFDENFGAGTQNYCGEETIFLSDCLRKKLKLIYIDKKIGEVEQKDSSWYEGISRKYITVEKECFKRIAPKWWWGLWFQFLIRKILPIRLSEFYKTILTKIHNSKNK